MPYGAFSANPGMIFLPDIGSTEQKFLFEILQSAKQNGYTRVVVPYAGSFNLCNLAVRAGFKPEQIEASDVNIASVVTGLYITGRDLDDLNIRKKIVYGKDENNPKDYHMVEDHASALYEMAYSDAISKAGNAYMYEILTSMKREKESFIAAFQSQLNSMKQVLDGIQFFSIDATTHVSDVLNDPQTIIIASPVIQSQFEKQYGDLETLFDWWPDRIRNEGKDEREVLMEMAEGKAALLLMYQERAAGRSIGYPVFARKKNDHGIICYISTNRKEEAEALAHGKKIKRLTEQKLYPLDCSMLPEDYIITEESDVSIIPIESAQAQYYRKLWTHNFVGSSATYNRAVLIDGYLAGVFGISKMEAESLFIWYVMKVPHERYRLGRLCYMLAMNRRFTNTICDFIEQSKVKKVRTAMLTKHPENKEVRGIMQLVNRVSDPVNGYKLTYEADIIKKRTEQQTLEEWLRKEKKWQQSRETIR